MRLTARNAGFFAVALLWTAGALAGCHARDQAPGPAERAEILKGAPELFAAPTTERGPAFADVDALYLGQSQEDALAHLEKLCPNPMDYRSGELGEGAWFRGCVLREPIAGVLSVRVGFWPKLGNRVSTLDIKRDDITLAQAREHFRTLLGDTLEAEHPHPGLVEMFGAQYQMMADIDEGPEGPTHIAFGYTHKWANRNLVQ